MVWMKIFLGVFLTDTGIKYWAEKHLPEQPARETAGGRLLLRKLHNYGAAVGLGKDNPQMVRRGTLAVWAGVLLGYLEGIRRGGSRLWKLGGAMLLGGGASNLFDRMTKGYVTDYVSLASSGKRLRSLVFNLSDFMIFAGTLLGMLGALIKKGKNSGGKEKS